MMKYAKLFEPGRIGKLEMRNRIVMAPMATLLSGLDGSISREEIRYYAERARGGVGLIITEVARVEDRVDHRDALTLNYADRDVLISAMADLANIVHKYGAKIAMQLTPGFGREQTVVDAQNPPVAPSAIPAWGNPAVICRPLTLEEIRSIIEAFGMATGRAARAGFDAVEVHAHCGYLADQFMTSLWNKRTDEYGGDLDGRMRFPLELVQSAKKYAGSDFPIIFRYSVEHYIPDGRGIEESQEMARRLQAGGVDAIDVNVACYDSTDIIWPNTYHMTDAPFAEMAAAIKKVVSIPVMVAGRMTPEAAEAVLESGKADLIISGRDLIADPDWPNKVRRGHREDVRPCIRCNEYCINHVFAFKTVTCSVNARSAYEWYYDMRKADTVKRVLVIGGGPAGMEAARVAALRGHHVTLLEKQDALGGLLRAAAIPTFKKELQRLVEWWATQLRKLEVNIQLNTEVTPAMLTGLEADAVVVACGARPLCPPIPGIEGENVVGVLDYHLGTKSVHGQNIAVAGGGTSGCDVALDLAMQGKNVTIVEMLDDVATDLNFPSRITLLNQLAERGVKILTKHKVEVFRNDGLIALGPDGEDKFIEADTVILALGMEPDNKLTKAVQERWTEVYVVGDCVKPAKVGEAVHAGFGAGWQL